MYCQQEFWQVKGKDSYNAFPHLGIRIYLLIMSWTLFSLLVTPAMCHPVLRGRRDAVCPKPTPSPFAGFLGPRSSLVTRVSPGRSLAGPADQDAELGRGIKGASFPCPAFSWYSGLFCPSASGCAEGTDPSVKGMHALCTRGWCFLAVRVGSEGPFWLPRPSVHLANKCRNVSYKSPQQ